MYHRAPQQKPQQNARSLAHECSGNVACATHTVKKPISEPAPKSVHQKLQASRSWIMLT